MGKESTNIYSEHGFFMVSGSYLIFQQYGYIAPIVSDLNDNISVLCSSFRHFLEVTQKKLPISHESFLLKWALFLFLFINHHLRPPILSTEKSPETFRSLCVDAVKTRTFYSILPKWTVGSNQNQSIRSFFKNGPCSFFSPLLLCFTKTNLWPQNSNSDNSTESRQIF